MPLHGAKKNTLSDLPAASSSSTADYTVVSPPTHLRKGSLYWKTKFEMAQGIIKEVHEKSLNLDEILGLLQISKIKSNQNVQNRRATQICGSMKVKRGAE